MYVGILPTCKSSHVCGVCPGRPEESIESLRTVL